MVSSEISLKTGLFWLLILALCFVAFPVHRQTEDEVRSLFEDYLQQHQKKYEGDEYIVRLKNFKDALDRIERKNALTPKNIPGAAIYGLTKFSDLSPEEFRQMYLRVSGRTRTAASSKNESSPLHLLAPGQAYPPKLDWREKGVVTAVKDQGQCGACWAFSVVECVESMNAIKYGSLESLSVQQVIDCARNGNMGCQGGNTCTAVQWMVDGNVPLAPESSYRLTLVDGRCPSERPASGVQIESNYSCASLVNREEDVVGLLNTVGPLSVAVDGTSWQDYLGGVIQFHCETNLNHAAQIVGYDRTVSPGYYIVRNSWGRSFGLDGYLHVAMGSNVCGIAMEVVSVSVK